MKHQYINNFPEFSINIFLQVTELKKFLPKVATLSHVINCAGYISGWQIIISETFRKIDINPTPKQIEDCIRALRLLHTCPVVNKLNFNDIINYCFSCNQPQFAVILVPFLDDEQKNNILKAIKKFNFLSKNYNNKKYITNFYLQVIKASFNVLEVISKLEMLSSKGVLAVSYVRHTFYY